MPMANDRKVPVRRNPVDEEREAGRSQGFLKRIAARFGEIARALGLIGSKDVRGALKHQEERKESGQPHKKIGKILVEQGKMSEEHVEHVLREQKKIEEARPMSPDEAVEFLRARGKEPAAQEAAEKAAPSSSDKKVAKKPKAAGEKAPAGKKAKAKSKKKASPKKPKKAAKPKKAT